MTVPVAKRQHFLALDLLRGVAALAVLFLHWLEGNSNPWFHNSHLAVDFFFMLSGFVMVYAYTERLKQGLGLWNFFVLRVIRLYPLIVVGIVLGFIRFFLKATITQDATMPLSWLVTKFVQNLFMIPNFQDGLSGDMFILNLALWSLFFEFLAYILFGLFMYRAKLYVLVAITAVAGIGVWGWLYQDFDSTRRTISALDYTGLGYVSGFCRVMFSFTLGLLTFEIYKRVKIHINLNGWIFAGLFFAFLCLPKGATPSNSAFFIMLFVFPALICLAAEAYIPAKTEALATTFGDLSYPLYVVHTPIIWVLSGLLKTLHLETIPDIWFGIIILPSAVIASYVAFHVYDKPVRAYLMQLYRNSKKRPIKA